MPVMNSASHMMRMQTLKSKKRKQQARKQQHANKQRQYPISKYVTDIQGSYSHYEGERNQNGENHGYGIHYTIDYMYEGYWFNNKFHGEGLLYIYSGDFYDCTWQHGVIQGIGRIKKNGVIYFGLMRTNKAINAIEYSRRSRRLSNFPPENNGLVFPKKKRRKIQKTTYKTILDDHLPLIISFIVTFLLLRFL